MPDAPAPEEGTLAPPARTTLAHDVAQQLLELIANGTYKVGDRLPTEKELVARLKVSRPTVREAMQRLALAGVVRTATRRGTIIAPVAADTVALHTALSTLVGRESLLDLSEVRAVLEPEMAAMAAERALPEQIDRLEALLAEQDAFVRAGDVKEFIDSDVVFHMVIAEMSANRVLLRMLRTVQGLLHESRRLTTQAPGALGVGLADHSAICASIRLHDADTARRLMREHLVHNRRDIERMLHEHRREATPVAAGDEGAEPPQP